MDKLSIKLQVFFEEPYWIGICERMEGNQLSVCKITFGAEPKEYEVEEFLLKNWKQLRFSPSVEQGIKTKQNVNPKRLQREVKKQMAHIGLGTKSQEALKLQHDQNKMEKKTRTRLEKEEEKERLFQLSQQKKKEKHKGR